MIDFFDVLVAAAIVLLVAFFGAAAFACVKVGSYDEAENGIPSPKDEAGRRDGARVRRVHLEDGSWYDEEVPGDDR